jgi:hypothetical protein
MDMSDKDREAIEIIRVNSWKDLERRREEIFGVKNKDG